MHIAIDASRCTVAKATGTEHYATQLIRHLIQANEALAQPHHLTLYFRDTPTPDLMPPSPHVTHKGIPFRRMWTHTRLAWAIAQDAPAVTFVPAHTLPFILRGRAVVTVHDLGYRLFPQAHPTRQRLYLDLTTRYSAMRAQRVFADSEATKRDLTHFYGINPAKISVIYPSVTIPTVNAVDVRAKYGLPARYWLFIGTLQPRKNIARLVQAYRQWQASTASDVGLVLAGNRGWLFDEAWVRDTPNVHVTGYIDEADKGALLHEAMGLLFPSLYEGFGFPVLEAMGVGTPVIAANTSSLPELVGDAGLQVDPLDVSAIAHAMRRLDEDRVLRQTLIKRGYEQVKRFDWRTSAEQALMHLTQVATG